MNVLNAIGRVGGDPELRFLPNGTPVLQFSFALNSGYGDKQITTWLRCSLFGKRAETLNAMLQKGAPVGITGELTNRPYTDKQGVEKYSLEARVNDLTLLGKKDGATGSASHEDTTPNEQNNDYDQDIPF